MAEKKKEKREKVHKEYFCEGNGQTYRGKSVSGAKKLDRRIKDYEAYVQHSSTGGKEFRKPGSINK